MEKGRLINYALLAFTVLVAAYYVSSRINRPVKIQISVQKLDGTKLLMSSTGVSFFDDTRTGYLQAARNWFEEELKAGAADDLNASAAFQAQVSDKISSALGKPIEYDLTDNAGRVTLPSNTRYVLFWHHGEKAYAYLANADWIKGDQLQVLDQPNARTDNYGEWMFGALFEQSNR